MRRLLLGLLLALVVVPVGAAATPAPTLLARHAPVLVLHPEEPLGPVAVDGFLADSDLVRRAPDGTWSPAGVALEDAAPGDRLDQRLCRAIDGPAAVPCYVGAATAHGGPSVAYGAVFRGGGRTALQYWLFYPVNVYRPPTAAGEFWQSHEGDWEAVTVLLGADERPVSVGLSRHCGGVARPWRRSSRRGSHPVAFVALGSHALGFAAGAVRLDERCWPPQAISVYRAYGVTLRDRYATGRTVRPRIVPVTAGTPAWMRFPGGWGEDQYVRFPSVDPLRFGQGPVGPAFHRLWRQPFATLAAWATAP